MLTRQVDEVCSLLPRDHSVVQGMQLLRNQRDVTKATWLAPSSPGEQAVADDVVRLVWLG